MPNSPPASVCVRDLVKHYGSVEALRGINFEVAAGEIFGLLGPNGAGKTTAIECVLGLRRPDSGAVAIDGIDALAFPGRAKERVGAQLQTAALQDKITPRQALDLFASFYRKPAGTGALLERFSLTAKADAAFDSLSHGQRQRLFLALAFVNRPSLVVLDEPTAGLDPNARRELHRMIAGVRDAGHAVLLSTHHMDEARSLCDRIAILDHGRIVATARPAELVSNANVRPKVAVKTRLPLDAARAGALPGVVRAESQKGGWLLSTTDVNLTITGLVKQLEADGNALADLQIQGPTLEDVFIELTGRTWSTEEDA